MDRLIALGTGKAHVTHCYNTCFILQKGEEYLLVDGGGGNGILAVLEKAGIEWQQIHHVFVTHEHVENLFGVIWVIRLIACELASRLSVKNLVLWHTEDKHLEARKQLYSQEGRKYYQGNLIVPDDLEVIDLRH